MFWFVIGRSFFFKRRTTLFADDASLFFKGVNTFLFYIILFTWAMYYSLTHWITLCFRNWKWLMWKIKQLNSFVVSLGPFFFVTCDIKCFSQRWCHIDSSQDGIRSRHPFLVLFHLPLLFIACVWWKSQKEDASMHFTLLIIKQ